MHAAGDSSHRAFDLGMAGMADQDDLAALVGVALAFAVHLRDQRTGGVDDRQPAGAGSLLDRARDAVGAEDGDAPGGISSISSTKRAPFARSRSTTWRLWTIS